MEDKELSEMTDQELLEKAKKLKRTAVLNAGLIGFLIGIIAYSVVKNSWGLVTLIPLFLIYKLVNTTENQALKTLLNERGLKY